MLAFCAMIEDVADVVTFEYIYKNYRKQMLYVATQFLPTHEDAEDAVQEALLQIAKYIKRIPAGNPEKQRAYVLTMAKNTSLAMLARKNQVDRHTDSSADVEHLEDPHAKMHFDALTQAENHAALQEMILSLPTQYREVLMLRYVFELQPRDIALTLHRKTSTVKQQLTRAKKMLLDIYRKEAVR